MKNYLVLYTPGMCGSWLTWLINQHKNFPHYFKNLKKYENDMGQSTILDVGCDGADWYIYNHDTIPQQVVARSPQNCPTLDFPYFIQYCK